MSVCTRVSVEKLSVLDRAINSSSRVVQKKLQCVSVCVWGAVCQCVFVCGCVNECMSSVSLCVHECACTWQV